MWVVVHEMAKTVPEDRKSSTGLQPQEKTLGVTSLNTKPMTITAQQIGYFRCKKDFGANFEKSRLIKAQHEIQHIEIPKKVSMQNSFTELNISGPELWLSEDSQNDN